MFRKKNKPERPTSELFDRRLKSLVRDTRDRPSSRGLVETSDGGEELDVMALLVELRAAAKRGSEPTGAKALGPEFGRYLGEFYNLPSEQQPYVIEALLRCRKQEQEEDLAAAVETCEGALLVCPKYLPLLERLAGLESRRNESQRAERWYSLLLVELDRLELYPRSIEICRELIEAGASDSTLLEQCARRLDAAGDQLYAAKCWLQRARQQLAADRPEEALMELDHAIGLQPENAELRLELALVYQRLEEFDHAAAAFEHAEALATNDPDTLGRVVLVRARVGRPEEAVLGRLMDLLEADPEARAVTLRRCEETLAANPYNPHPRYVHGVLLAQDGRSAEAVASIKIAADRYHAQSDGDSELEARLAIQQLAPRDADNRRRVAELHFERGEVHLAMQSLAGLARATRDVPA